MSGTILQTVVGLLVGAGIGAVVGFVTWALMEKFTSRSGLIIAPSGPLNVGIIGAVMVGLIGVVIGATTGVLGLGTLQAAAVGVVIFAVLKGRAIYSEGRVVMSIADVALLLDFALVGALISLCLPYFSGY